MNLMGVKIPNFEEPVCNSFQEKILNDQLCYEVDLDKFSNKSNIDKELKLGFSFIMDYNEDRQVIVHEDVSTKKKSGLTAKIVESNQDRHALMYFNTIGNNN